MAVITISRQVAALGDEIASATAQKLGYEFIDRKAIERRILDLGFSPEKLKKYDERKPGFFASLAKDRDEYLDYLQMAILEAASKDNCILIGRGSFIILEDLPNLLSFRFVAKDSVRMERLKKEFGWDDKKARQRIDESDSNRLGFHKSFFNLENEEPSHFHLVVNTGLLDIETVAGMITDMVKKTVTAEKEAAGKIKIEQLILAQRLVNTLVFDHKLNINFLHAVICDKKVILQGVADSSGIVEKVVGIASRELPDYKVESAISVVQDFKAYP
jgi:cytidylate kinase